MSVSSSAPSDTLEITYLERLRDEFGSPAGQSASPDPNPALNHYLSAYPNRDTNRNEPEEDTEEYEFRLFSGSNAADTVHGKTLQRIAIRSPSPFNGDPGFVIPQRPSEYYFTGKLDVSCEEEFLAAAVSGDEVLKGLGVKWVCIPSPTCRPVEIIFLS